MQQYKNVRKTNLKKYYTIAIFQLLQKTNILQECLGKNPCCQPALPCAKFSLFSKFFQRRKSFHEICFLTKQVFSPKLDLKFFSINSIIFTFLNKILCILLLPDKRSMKTPTGVLRFGFSSKNVGTFGKVF